VSSIRDWTRQVTPLCPRSDMANDTRMTQEPTGAYGRLELFSQNNGTAEAAGWLVHPSQPIEAVRVRIAGAVLGEAPVIERPDVAAAFPWVPHAAASGFRVRGPFAATTKLLRVEALGITVAHPIGVAEDYWPAGGVPDVPAPDAALMERVSGGRKAGEFNRAGFGIAAQLLAAVRAHLPGIAAPRLLDWGCGSGRATRFMPTLWPGLRLVGCDIDAEAIAWCRENVPGGTFHATDPFPPLPFADANFDAVVAASVMTHLTWPIQQQWLTEIRRTLRPGGVFVTSVHGRLAATPLPADQRAVLAERGVLDETLDARLDGIAPAGYYRGTYQTEQHTRRHWQCGFRIRAWREGGLANWQDLVVLQRTERGWLSRLLRRHSVLES
jgi:SAM-dependent methyltransferase